MENNTGHALFHEDVYNCYTFAFKIV